MATIDIVVLALIVAGFVLFGVTLAWVSRHDGEPAKPRPKQPARRGISGYATPDFTD